MPSDNMGIKRTSTSFSTSPTPQPLPTVVWIAGKSKKLAGFYPKSLSLVQVIPATNFFDLGIGLDQRFEDFLITRIALDTYALLARVAVRRPLCGWSLGSKIIPISSSSKLVIV
ncbi:unnamed protein product [Prunus armeniaca]